MQFMDRINTHYFQAIKDDLEPILDHLKDLKPKRTRKKIEYYNIACAFDIETTSFFQHSNGDIIDTKTWAMMDMKSRMGWYKVATMYIWQLGIDGYCIIGRTWDEFTTLLDIISDTLELSEDKRMVIYVHNLSFEFNWIKQRFNWSQVFATKPYMPLCAVTDTGFEFRCTYRNTNKSLAEVGKDLVKYKVQKAVGCLDYDLLRNSVTQLTDEEILYCINDIKVVMCYIQEQIEIEGCVNDIPLTKTGYVRRDVKKNCFMDKENPKKSKLKRFKYRSFINNMRLDVESYEAIHKATLGGFTHANILFSNEIVKNVDSLDIASSYPAIMLSNAFPMSTPKWRDVRTIKQAETYMSAYCCIMTIELTELQTQFDFDSYLSTSRCSIVDNGEIDNGRIRSADRIVTTITDVDYWIIKRWYKYKRIRIKNFYTMIRDYLPKPIIESILSYYEGKTKLKGIEGRENDYMRSKGNINSCFGMMIQGIINQEITLEDGNWVVDEITPEMIKGCIDDYNNNRGRFLYYPWGAFVTAYGRRNITAAIFEAGEDYIYTDTDSIKLLNYDKHKVWFDGYNRHIQKKINKCLDHYNIDRQLARPTDSKGNEKPMGVFDLETVDGAYKRFKTIGAKRYMYEDDKGIHITVAGLSKQCGRNYLIRSGIDPFKLFTNNMHVDALSTGKLTHTYIDVRKTGYMTDYQGNRAYYDELSGVHLAPCDFSMTITDEYIKLMEALKISKFNPNLI